MDTGHVAPRGRGLTAVASHLRSVWPSSTAKRVAGVLGCTHRQARRILSEGHVPTRFETRLIAALDRDYERARQEMERRHDEIRGYRLALMARRAAARADSITRPHQPEHPSPDQRTTLPSLIADGDGKGL